jgi:hypothetical protein
MQCRFIATLASVYAANNVPAQNSESSRVFQRLLLAQLDAMMSITDHRMASLA